MSAFTIINEVIRLPELTQIIMDYYEKTIIIVSDGIIQWYDVKNDTWNSMQCPDDRLMCGLDVSFWCKGAWIDGISGLRWAEEFPTTPGMQYHNSHQVVVESTWYQIGGGCDYGSGYFCELQELWVYHTKWIQLPSFTYYRENYAVAVVGTRIYVIGGRTPGYEPRDNLHELDPHLTPYIEYFDTIDNTWFVVDTSIYQGVYCVTNVHNTTIWITSSYGKFHAFDTLTSQMTFHLYGCKHYATLVSTDAALYRVYGTRLDQVDSTAKFTQRLKKHAPGDNVYSVSSYLLRQFRSVCL